MTIISEWVERKNDMRKVIEICDDCQKEFQEGKIEHFKDNFSSEEPRPQYDLCIPCIRKRVALTIKTIPVGSEIPMISLIKQVRE